MEIRASRLVEYARFFKDNKWDITEMLDTFSSYDEMLRKVMNQELEFERLNTSSLLLRQQNEMEENLLQQRRIKNAELESLKRMGFGLVELKILYNIIVELAAENGQSADDGEAVTTDCCFKDWPGVHEFSAQERHNAA